MAFGIYRRGDRWYWRINLRLRAQNRPTFRYRPVQWKLDIALSLGQFGHFDRIEIAGRFSSLVRRWIAQFEMIGVLEKLPEEDIRILVSWALADIRDLYRQRVENPRSLSDPDRKALIKKLEAEAICIQSAIDCGNFEMLEGLAAALLRRRSIASDFNGIHFGKFVSAVAPAMLEARLSELVRLGAEIGGGMLPSQSVTLLAAPVEVTAPGGTAIDQGAVQSRLNPRTGHALSGHLIEDCLEHFLRDMRVEQRFSMKTTAQYRQTIGLLIEYFGNLPAHRISRAMAADFRSFVLTLPKYYGKSSHYVGLPLKEIPSKAQKINDRATIAPPTWNRHHVALSSVWAHAQKNGDVFENVFEGQRFRRTRARGGRRPAHEERLPFLKENLTQLFTSPIFTGMRSEHFRNQPGALVRHDALFWLPLLMLLAGLRREEAAQIKFKDLGEIQGIACIQVREGSGQTLKTEFSARNIPISDELRRLGFMEFVQDRKSKGGEFLFKDCQPSGKFQRRGEVVGKAFGRYLRKIGIKDPMHSMYSLRHDFASALTHVGVDGCLVDRLMGHSTGRLAFDRYASGLEKKLLEELNRVEHPELTSVRPYAGQ